MARATKRRWLGGVALATAGALAARRWRAAAGPEAGAVALASWAVADRT